jgi:hypothetical protein
MSGIKYIELDHGGGGKKSNDLIDEIRKIINIKAMMQPVLI